MPCLRHGEHVAHTVGPELVTRPAGNELGRNVGIVPVDQTFEQINQWNVEEFAAILQ
jgi:hypothetical protein